MNTTATKTRTTKSTPRKTIYRECSCGENAHDYQADRRDGMWIHYWACRNCGAEIHPVSR